MRLKLDLKLVFRKLSLFEAEREDISLDILMSRHRFSFLHRIVSQNKLLLEALNLDKKDFWLLEKNFRELFFLFYPHPPRMDLSLELNCSLEAARPRCRRRRHCRRRRRRRRRRRSCWSRAAHWCTALGARF